VLHIPAVIFSLQNCGFNPTYPVSFSKHFEPLLTFQMTCSETVLHNYMADIPFISPAWLLPHHRCIVMCYDLFLVWFSLADSSCLCFILMTVHML